VIKVGFVANIRLVNLELVEIPLLAMWPEALKAVNS
jgi:hypothetical protein